MELGALEVYQAFEGELCAGTLRRLELHVHGLSEVFRVDPPRARLFIHRDLEAIEDLCHGSDRTRGCASWWGAHAMADAATHELVHVFVSSLTNDVDTRPALEEGVAWYLAGAGPGLWGDIGAAWESPATMATLDDLRSLLAIRSSSELYETELRRARNFSAWAIDHVGIDAYLGAYAATAAEQTDEEVQQALAENLGFSSFSGMHAEYAATRAFGYPPVPNTFRVFSAEELARGVMLDTSCAGEYTEGPIGDELMTVVWLEIAQSGEHAAIYEPLPLGLYEPRLQLVEPLYEELPTGTFRAEACGYDWSPDALHIAFPRAGRYEISGRDCRPGGSPCWGRHPADEAAQATISLRYLGNDECQPF